eukprot:s559_g7.t1
MASVDESLEAAYTGRGTGFLVQQDDGRVYYYNRATGSSQWHLPNHLYQSARVKGQEAADLVFPGKARAMLRVDCVTEAASAEMLASAMASAGMPPEEIHQANPLDVLDHFEQLLPPKLTRMLTTGSFLESCLADFQEVSGGKQLPIEDAATMVCTLVNSLRIEPSLALSEERCLRLAQKYDVDALFYVGPQEFLDLLRYVVVVRHSGLRLYTQATARQACREENAAVQEQHRLEKEMSGCTFRPNLQKSDKSFHATSTFRPSPRGADACAQRMRKAFAEKDSRRRFLEERAPTDRPSQISTGCLTGTYCETPEPRAVASPGHRGSSGDPELRARSTWVTATPSPSQAEGASPAGHQGQGDAKMLAKHRAGRCKPCVFFASNHGCPDATCSFCHLVHPLPPKQRPEKLLREEFRAAVQTVFRQTKDQPDLRLALKRLALQHPYLFRYIIGQMDMYSQRSKSLGSHISRPVTPPSVKAQEAAAPVNGASKDLASPAVRQRRVQPKQRPTQRPQAPRCGTEPKHSARNPQIISTPPSTRGAGGPRLPLPTHPRSDATLEAAASPRPLLIAEVNISQALPPQKIFLYASDDVSQVARRFAERHHLAPHLAERLKRYLTALSQQNERAS